MTPRVPVAPPFEQGSDFSASEDFDRRKDSPLLYHQHDYPEVPPAQWQYPPLSHLRSHWYPSLWGPLHQPPDPPSRSYWGSWPQYLPLEPSRSAQEESPILHLQPLSSRHSELGLEDALLSPTLTVAPEPEQFTSSSPDAAALSTRSSHPDDYRQFQEIVTKRI